MLSEAVPMDRWRKIIERAVTDAEQGDAKAREWLGSHLMGEPTGNALLKLAAAELAGFDPVADEANDLGEQKSFLDLLRDLKSRQAD